MATRILLHDIEGDTRPLTDLQSSYNSEPFCPYVYPSRSLHHDRCPEMVHGRTMSIWEMIRQGSQQVMGEEAVITPFKCSRAAALTFVGCPTVRTLPGGNDFALLQASLTINTDSILVASDLDAISEKHMRQDLEQCVDIAHRSQDRLIQRGLEDISS